MFSFIFDLFYYPLYNGLIFLAALVPGGDIGISIILLTLITKLIILPITHKSLEAQKKMREIEPKMKEIKELCKNNQEEQAKRIMQLYKEHGVNPFSSIFLLFLQLPIFIALYYIFSQEIDLASPVIFSFNLVPESINKIFLGFIDLGVSNLYLALLVGITQFIQTKLSVPEIPKSQQKNPTFADDFAKSMNWQVKYFLPFFITYIAMKLNAGVSLYWITNNLFGIGHEVFVRYKAKIIKEKIEEVCEKK